MSRTRWRELVIVILVLAALAAASQWRRSGGTFPAERAEEAAAVVK